MADMILDVCYDQAKISAYEIGESNLSHVKKIISLLDSGKEQMINIESGIVDSIDNLIRTLDKENNHYSSVAEMQNIFCATVKTFDEEMSSQLSKLFTGAMQETSRDIIYKNINMFKTLSSLSILDGLSEQEINVLGNAFVLKGLLENSSSTEDLLIKLKKLYDDKKISKDEYEDLADYMKINGLKITFDNTKDYITDSIKDYLMTKSTTGITLNTLLKAFKNLNSNLNDTLITASLVKSTDDLLAYSIKFDALKDSYISLKEQMKSVAFSKGVGFVTTVITAAELWNDFNYDMNTIEMSNTEAFQNFTLDLIGVGAGIGGTALGSSFASIFGASTLPGIGLVIIGGVVAIGLYDYYLKEPLKDKMREFDDWCEQISW